MVNLNPILPVTFFPLIVLLLNHLVSGKWLEPKREIHKRKGQNIHFLKLESHSCNSGNLCGSRLIKPVWFNLELH